MQTWKLPNASFTARASEAVKQPDVSHGGAVQMTNTDIARITNTNAIVLDMLNMDELVHEADCLAQGQAEFQSFESCGATA